ncbi:hypothetical protein [Nostoc sp. MG11]|uniref:hypothetical protein n=1 Tax=Nostoc sp. MG11 TaxID=2721166 RepID=UPI0018666CB1|nr:hypothetical protein [Nostoc sp. MG11]
MFDKPKLSIKDVLAGEPEPKSDITLFQEYRSEFNPEQRFKGGKAYVGEDLITTPNIFT